MVVTEHITQADSVAKLCAFNSFGTTMTQGNKIRPFCLKLEWDLIYGDLESCSFVHFHEF